MTDWQKKWDERKKWELDRKKFVDKITQELSKVNSRAQQVKNSRFFAEDNFSAAEFDVEVDEVGHLSFPLDLGNIKKLISVASQSRFGLREQTILDTNVRNSYEISQSNLKVNIANQSLNRILKKMCKSLGLPADSSLTPHLNNMLIYAPGHFFKMHQDTEKLENMVATLVIVLPSPHIGGNLTLKHDNKEHVFSTENLGETKAKCIAFYADCMHGVERVKEGYRVALTYNLVLETSAIDTSQPVNETLKCAIQDYFNFMNSIKLPDFAVFLDYSYTESGLRWDMLKGTDRINASEILVVARELDLIPYLTLVDIQENWQCGHKAKKPLSINEVNTHVMHWVDSNNKKLKFGMHTINNDQCCMTKPNKAFKPHSSEYTGWQGNWGCTHEYWYKRSAILLFPKSAEIKLSFKVDPQAALRNLCELSRLAENIPTVLNLIEENEYNVFKNCHECKKEDFDLFAEIAVNLKDEEKAQSLLGKFRWSILEQDIIHTFVSLQQHYSSKFCIDLLIKWEAETKSYSSAFMIKNVNDFLVKFLSIGGAKEVAKIILARYSKTILNRAGQMGSLTFGLLTGELKMNKVELLEDVLKACVKLEDLDILQNLVCHVMENTQLYSLVELAELFFKLTASLSADSLSLFNGLRDYLAESFERELLEGRKANNDWSINVTVDCSCEHCTVLQEFLLSKTQQMKTWVLGEKMRIHVINNLTDMEQLISQEVEKAGSRRKLILKKKPAVEGRETFKKVQIYYQKFL